jgi:predicted nucleic acid-binding protein
VIRVVHDTNQLVSGDSHLLDLREHAGIPIVTTRAFLEVLSRESPPIHP